MHIPLGTFFVHGALNGLKLVEVSQCSLCILAFSLVFTPYGHISRTQSFQQNRHIFFLALVALKLLVYIAHKPPRSLLVIVVDKHTQNDCRLCNLYIQYNYNYYTLSFTCHYIISIRLPQLYMRPGFYPETTGAGVTIIIFIFE